MRSVSLMVALGIGSLVTGCELMVGTEDKGVADGGDAVGDAPASDADAAAAEGAAPAPDTGPIPVACTTCLSQVDTCHRACTQTSSTCASQCPTDPCTKQCAKDEMHCSDECTTTCTTCAHAAGTGCNDNGCKATTGGPGGN